MTLTNRAPILLALLSSMSCGVTIEKPGVNDQDTAGIGGSGGDGDSDTDTDTDADTDEPEERIRATIRGTVTVEAYIEGEDGREAVDEEEFFGGSFPFGPVFVSATTGDAGALTYIGSDAILTPSFAGDTYELEVSMLASGEVGVYAALDDERDFVIQSDDPIGVHPDMLDVSDGAVFDNVDITILVEAHAGSGGGSGSGSGSGSGGNGCDLLIDGDFSVTSGRFAAGTPALAMLVTTAGEGPTDFAWVDVAPSATGGEGEYSMETCPNQGQMNLVGAYDSNANSLIDPDDVWGSYAPAPDTDGNPISVTTGDLSGYPIQVPLGAGDSPLSIVPFVRLNGTVTFAEGTFDDLPSGSTVYVAALKYRPSGAISVASIESDAYDFETVEWPDLTGTSSFDYQLGVPANSEVYLWAFADSDVDGRVNESGEAIASGGEDDNGRVQLGTSDQTQDLELGYAEVR